jgi:galactokinase
MNDIFVSAPGRACLFGEDQDYLGLSVITVAINLRTYVRGRITNNNIIKINCINTNETDEFSIDKKIEYRSKRDYLRATINILKRDERIKMLLKGIECEIWSEIPIASGLSSSSVLVVAWVKFLSSAFGLKLDEKEIAQLAFQSEVAEFGEPGGMMDHIASAVGGQLHIKCTNPPQIQRLDPPIYGLVIGDTLVKKKTIETLVKRKSEIFEGISFVSKQINDFNLETVEMARIEPHLLKMDGNAAKRLKAVIEMRDIVTMAVPALKIKDEAKIGDLINRHHKCMRDGFENVIAKAEDMIKASLNAGAIGGKVTGSGNGGCVLIFAPLHQLDAAKAIEQAGGKAYIVQVDEGARDEKPNADL